jgi:hypothetical protein
LSGGGITPGKNAKDKTAKRNDINLGIGDFERVGGALKTDG